MGRNVRWLVCGSYVVLWTMALLLPLSAIEKLPPTQVLLSHRVLIAKSLHVAAYALMTILCGWLHVPARFRWLVVFFLMGHATFTEIMQFYYIPGRIGILQDVAIDQVGVTIGLLLTWNWWVKKDE
jgi:VanZ family protein